MVAVVARHERCAVGVEQVKDAAGAFHHLHSSLNDEPVHGHVTVFSGDGFSKIMEEAEHAPFFLDDGLFLMQEASERVIFDPVGPQ